MFYPALFGRRKFCHLICWCVYFFSTTDRASAVQDSFGPAILDDFEADPSARVFDGKLYLYPSHDLPDSVWWKMVDWKAFSSDDLTHWEDHGVIFGLNRITWADRYAWAPDCVKRNGKYYFYFPADGRIGVAVGDSPIGPFRDALGKPLVGTKTTPLPNAIDPNVFIDDDGKAYLFFGGFSHFYYARLNPDMTSLEGPPQPLTLPFYHEGIWVYKRQGIYYFTYPTFRGAINGEMKANLLEYSTAENILGPFTYRGVILDNRSRNVHHSIVDFQGRTLLFFHVQGPSPYERKVHILPLEFEDNGRIRNLSPDYEVGNTVRKDARGGLVFEARSAFLAGPVQLASGIEESRALVLTGSAECLVNWHYVISSEQRYRVIATVSGGSGTFELSLGSARETFEIKPSPNQSPASFIELELGEVSLSRGAGDLFIRNLTHSPSDSFAIRKLCLVPSS